MENGSRALVSCLVVAGLRLGFYSRNGKGDFRAACIFKSIVGSDRDGVLPGHQRRQAEVVMLDKRVADAGGRSHENPVAAVQAVLGSLDGRRSITRREGCRMAAAHFSRGRTYPEVFYHRRRIIHLEALAFALGFEGE